MSGSSGGGSPITKYVIPGLMTAIGVGSEVVAPGNPIGLGLAGSGVGALAGGAAGGSKGEGIGGAAGGLLGMGGGMLGGNSFLEGLGTTAASPLGPQSTAGDIMASVNPMAGSIDPATMTPTAAISKAGGLGNMTSLAAPLMTMASQLEKPPTPQATPQAPGSVARAPAMPQPVAPIASGNQISPISALQKYRQFLMAA
jgi:hypothetical protein